MLLLTSCVYLDRLLKHSVFQFPYLYNDDISAYLLEFLELIYVKMHTTKLG